MISPETSAAQPGVNGPGGGVSESNEFSPGRPLRRNLLMLAGGQTTTWTMTLIWTVVVPRLLGPVGMGLISSAMAITSILGILAGLGTQAYLTREIAARPGSAGRLVGTALWLRVIMTPVVAAGSVAFAHFANYGPDARLVLWLVTASMLIDLLRDPLMSTFQAREHMQYFVYTDVFAKTSLALLGIVIVVIGFGAVGIAASWVAVSTAAVGLGFRWIRPFAKIQWRTSLRQLIELVRASISYLALSLSNLIYTWIDTVMLSVMTRPEVVGWYAAPTKLLGAILFIPVIISTAWYPRLVRAFESSEDELRVQARVPIELVMVLSLPVCTAIALGAQPIIPLLYGDAYRRSVPITVILGFTAIPMYANIIFSTVLMAMRRQGRLTCLMAVAAVVNPVLNFFFIRLTEHRYHSGAIGAAICLLLTELMVVAVELVLVGRWVLSPSSLFRVARAALASVGLGMVGYLARPLGWYVSLPLAGLTFLVLGWIFRLAGPQEKDAIRSGIYKITAPISRHRG